MKFLSIFHLYTYYKFVQYHYTYFIQILQHLYCKIFTMFAIYFKISRITKLNIEKLINFFELNE